MKQDRFLIGILAAIGLLVVVSVAMFFIRGEQTYAADDTPEGVIQNFVLAIQNRDTQRAYDYLADKTNKPSYDEVRRSILNREVGNSDNGLQIIQTHIQGDEATIELNILYSGSGPFSEGWSNSGTAILVKQNGAWKIDSMPYPFWNWNWYQEPAKPAP